MGVEFNPQQKKCVMNTQNSSNILQNLSKNNSSSLFNDNFYKFSKEQYLLREQIYKQVVDIQSNSTLLRTKAENAK
jgi:heme oxygenase